MMQIKLHPGKRQAGSQESHPTRRLLLPLRPVHPPLRILPLLPAEAPDQFPQSPCYLLHLGPQPTPRTPGTPAPYHTHTNSWALGPPEPEGHTGRAQRPALLGRQAGGSGGAGRAGLLPAAPEGGAGRRHRAAPRGARPRVRLFSKLLPLGNHVSEPGRGLKGPEAVRWLAAGATGFLITACGVCWGCFVFFLIYRNHTIQPTHTKYTIQYL